MCGYKSSQGIHSGPHDPLDVRYLMWDHSFESLHPSQVLMKLRIALDVDEDERENDLFLESSHDELLHEDDHDASSSISCFLLK